MVSVTTRLSSHTFERVGWFNGLHIFLSTAKISIPLWNKWNTLSFLNPSIYISFGYIFELDGRASHEIHRDEFIRGTNDDSTVQRAKFFLRDSHLEGGFVHRLESVNIHALRSGTLEETQRTKHRFIVPDTVVSLSLPPSSLLSLSLSPAMNAKSGHDGVRTTPLTMTKRKSTQFHPLARAHTDEKLIYYERFLPSLLRRPANGTLNLPRIYGALFRTNISSSPVTRINFESLPICMESGRQIERKRV